jgi:hypothetical protein
MYRLPGMLLGATSFMTVECCGTGSVPGSARFFYSPQRPDRRWGPPSLLWVKVFIAASSYQVFLPNLSVHFYSFPCILHALPISFFLT